MSPQLRAFVPFVFAWLWSTGFVSAKFGLPYAEPFTLLSLRHIFTIPIFAGIILVLGLGFGPRHAIPQQLLVGFFLHGLHLGGVFYAIKNGMPAGVSAIIVGLQPLLSFVLARIFFQERLSKRQIFGLVLGFVGIAIVLGPDLASANIPWVGVFGSICGLVGLSVGTVMQKRMQFDMPLATGGMWQFVGALAALGLLSLLTETQDVEFVWRFSATIAWLVLGISVTAMLLLTLMIREGAVSEVAAYFYLVTPLAVFQAWLFFGEYLSILAILGAVLTVFGVYLATSRSDLSDRASGSQ
ncbi:MAG: DMT family transporter [Pseudomonadota bacterium]